MSKEEKVNSFVDINKKIHEEISKSANTAAIGKLIDKKADEEISRRVDLLEKGLMVWNNTEKELKRCVPDVITHSEVEGTENGTALQNRSYSDSRYKEKGALKKKLADIEVALMLAFGENQDYSKLEGIIKSSGNKKDNSKPQPEQEQQ